MKYPAILGSLLTAALVLLSGQRSLADNWPLWRGPANDGVCKETKLPSEWSATKNVVWKLAMPGSGGSTPVVWGKKIFLTSEDGNKVVVLCISTDGKKLWEQTLATAEKMRYGPGQDEGNLASASPSTDGEHVYVFCGTGDFAAYDLEGKELWKFNAQERYGAFKMQWGTHTSPVLDGHRLYLQLIHGRGAWVIAIDKATGKEIWKVARKSDARGECLESYATPSVWRNGKDAYLVTHGGDYAIAYNLEDGSEIWRVGGLNPKDKYRADLRFVSSPVVTPDLIVVPSAKRGPVVAIKPDAHGLVDSSNPAEVWRLAKGTPDVPSPLVYDGLVYLCGEDGRLTCLDAKTGKELYSQALHPNRYRASPVYADGKIYLTARDGIITVVKAGPKCEILAVNSLGADEKHPADPITASPAISDGKIYLRGFDTLYAIGQGKE